MTRWVVALVGLVLAAPATAAPPVVAIRARTAVTLDPVQRQPDGVRVSGLVHERGSLEPVPDAPVSVTFDDQVMSARSDTSGRFAAFFSTTGGRHRLAVSFRGDDRFDPADVAIPDFDVSKRPTRVEVTGPERHSRLHGPLALTVFAQDEIDPISIKVAVRYGPADADDLPRVAEVTTDARGSASLNLPPDMLGPPGAKRVEVEFTGSDAFDVARAQTAIIVHSTTTLSFELSSREVGFEGSARGHGRLLDDRGQPIAGQSVSLVIDGPSQATPPAPGAAPGSPPPAPETRTVDDAVTGENGGFTLEARASELGAGSYRVQATFDSMVPYLESKRSTPVQLVVADRKPVPVGYSLAAFGATAAALLAFVVLRTRPWTRWLKTLRGQTAATAATPDRGDAPPQHGLVLARPGLVNTLRRAQDHGFSGVVSDAVTARPVAGAKVLLSAPGGEPREVSCDDAGRFSLEELPAGMLRAAVSSPGYVTEDFPLTIPHRGELRDARVDLLPVRERIFALYRTAAEPLLPKPELWGVWTPRQIVDHVRQARPARALAELTDYVEEKYFSARVPLEDELAAASARVRDAAAEQGGA